MIYIDPPYNTGKKNDFRYNDHFVGEEDAYRHSKWLQFMAPRLNMAKELLSRDGVVIVSIDDNEMAHLRLLMDQIFVESNFIATVIWEGGRKNDSNYISVGHDYFLIYARDKGFLKSEDARWLVAKAGVKEILLAAARIKEEHAGDEIGRAHV